MSNTGGNNDAGHIEDNRLLREAQRGEFVRFNNAMVEIREALAGINTRLDAVERATPNRNERHREERNRIPQDGDGENEAVDDDEDEEEAYVEFRAPRGGGRQGRGRGRGRLQAVQYNGKNRGNEEGVDRNLGSIKHKIPPFQGKSDPESYLQWEKQLELIFDCHQFSEEKKVKLAVTQFSDYAIAWWDHLIISRRRNLEYPIDNWHELKVLMRKRFVPKHYHRELVQKLQVLKQGSKSVDETLSVGSVKE